MGFANQKNRRLLPIASILSALTVTGPATIEQAQRPGAYEDNRKARRAQRSKKINPPKPRGPQ